MNLFRQYNKFVDERYKKKFLMRNKKIYLIKFKNFIQNNDTYRPPYNRSVITLITKPHIDTMNVFIMEKQGFKIINNY